MFDSSLDEVAPLIFYPSRIPTKADNRTKFQRKFAIWLILFAVGFERLAFYSLAGNLVLFLTSDAIRWTSLHSVTASLVFFGNRFIQISFRMIYILMYFKKVQVIYQHFFLHG